jgi:DNA modification methylase
MHDAIFPKELPELCIRLGTTQKSDVVLDPFLGSGTTILAASHVGRRSVGYEINSKYARVIKKKLFGVQKLQIIGED